MCKRSAAKLKERESESVEHPTSPLVWPRRSVYPYIYPHYTDSKSSLSVCFFGVRRTPVVVDAVVSDRKRSLSFIPVSFIIAGVLGS